MYSELLLNNNCYVLNKLFVKDLTGYFVLRLLLGAVHVGTARGR